MTFAELQDAAETAAGESSAVDFKSQFDPTSKGDWPELVKDIVAMANTEGGCILFGLDDNVQPTELDCSDVLSCDPADITNKIYSFAR